MDASERARISPARSPGDSTSTTRSGARSGKRTGMGSGSRSRRTNAMSGARRVSGPRDKVAGLGREDLSTARALHVITDPQGEVDGDAAMAPARRLPDDKHAADQLRSLVRDTRVAQLLGGHLRRGHTQNVGALGGHSNPNPAAGMS